ncbi:MAG: glycosyltransferase [Clostridiales bacterium]|nr:glycosyltransferase [Clostridiales bacterium]
MIVIKVIFWISVFVIFWANIGYPISIILLDKIIKKKKLPKKLDYEPKVTIMVVAHNEEKVIEEKLENLLKIDYPKEKIEILVSSDNSTDSTNIIVKEFIEKNKDRKIVLYEVKERKGKTNAQNEAAKLVKSEILVMTDANSLLKKNAISEMVASFYDDTISYVTGRLCYINSENSDTSKSENIYWDLDTKIRDIESKFQTITAGNGALYACRTKEYYDFESIKCHDSAMPLYYALKQKRAIANHDAIAYEKAGENIQDEFKRKVRMNRIILSSILPSIRILNIFKYKWFTFFYLGHRTCRYLLWLMHILAYISSIILVKQSCFFVIALILQSVIYLMAIIKTKIKLNNKILNMAYYYCITIAAQLIGVKNILTGKAKPFWEKAESTR